jgi:ubiquilin
MQSYMQQITQNPRLMESIINTPYMQSVTQSLATNPELTRQIMNNNPLLQSNPELREQLMRTMPTLLQQMQNPEMQSLLANPEALQAVLQIQEGMQRLQSTAPGLLTG